MKGLLVIVVLAVGGWFAYSHWFAAEEESAGDAPGAFDGVGEEEDEAADTPADPDATDAAGFDAEIEELLADCERRWEAIVAADARPALDPQAPALARDYSAVLQATYNKPALKETQERIVAERLTPLADTLFFSRYRYPDDETGIFALHTVERGERPDSIGREYGMSYQFINLMREHPPESGELKLGETLKVLRAKEHGGYLVHVDKSDFFADVFVCGILIRRFPVGIGAPESPTPVGTGHIDMRSLEPDWTDPETGEVYAWNDPRNLLGRVWLRIKADEIGQDGIGLHGFNGDPAQAVRVEASNGCVRMRNDDAELLYQILVPVGYYETKGFLQRAPMLVEIVE